MKSSGLNAPNYQKAMRQVKRNKQRISTKPAIFYSQCYVLLKHG